MPVVTRARSNANLDASGVEQFNNAAALALAPAPPPPHAPVIEPPALLPHENLKSYVRSVKIPNPQFGRGIPTICRGRDRITPKDLHLLSIEPDSRIRLKEVWVSRPPTMAERVKNFMRCFLPNGPIPNAESRGIYIRTANFNFEAPGYMTFIDQPSPVNDILSLANFTMQILETAERVVNLVWPQESKGLRFTFPPADCSSVPPADAPLCMPLYYQKVREEDLVKVTEPMVKIVVVVVAPWALAMSDMHEMLTTGRFPVSKDGRQWPAFSRAQKIWAQIYQCCSSQNCPFFIMTTYDQWFFGSFHTASGWSRVIVTTMMAHSNVQPNTLEWVIFWCASALKINGGWSSVKFSNPNNPEIACPHYLQVDESPHNRMTDEEWINAFEFHSKNDRDPSPVTAKVEGRDNIYITQFPMDTTE